MNFFSFLAQGLVRGKPDPWCPDDCGKLAADCKPPYREVRDGR